MLHAAAAALFLAAVPIDRPTTQELEAFGRDIAADFAQGRDGLSTRLDFDAFLERVLAPLRADEDFKRDFRSGALRAGLPIGKALLTFLGPKGRVAFRRVDATRGDVVYLRLISEKGAFNFVKLLVARDAKGALRVVDVYSLTSGNLTSEDVRQIAVMALAESRQGLLDRLAGSERLLLTNVKAVRRMGDASLAGRSAEAFQVWSELPRELRESRIFLLQSVSLAMAVGDDPYRRQVERYLQLYPKDPAARVIAIDACFLRRDWACADEAVSGVERWLGVADGWLLTLHGMVAVSAGRRADARAAYRRAIEVEPTLVEPYANLLDLVLADRDWKSTADLLGKLERDAGVVLDDLTQVESFRPFLASAEGKAFKRRRAAGARK